MFVVPAYCGSDVHNGLALLNYRPPVLFAILKVFFFNSRIMMCAMCKCACALVVNRTLCDHGSERLFLFV